MSDEFVCRCCFKRKSISLRGSAWPNTSPRNPLKYQCISCEEKMPKKNHLRVVKPGELKVVVSPAKVRQIHKYYNSLTNEINSLDKS